MSHRHRVKRRKPHFSRRTGPGDAPGQVRPDPQAPKPIMRLMAFGADGLVECDLKSIEEAAAHRRPGRIVWLDVEGLGDADAIQQIGKLFALHPLALEDVVNVHQRPKVETYPDNVFVVLRAVMRNDRLETEQISMFLGRDFIVTFQETPGDPFEPVRKRLREDRGRLRAGDTGNLTYALIDAVVDGYFPIVEDYGAQLDALEDDLVGRPNRNLIARAHEIKHDLRTLRRAVWPLREAIRALGHEATDLISPETQIYLRDCYDHVAQIMDLVETYREVNSDLTDLYLSSLSNRMNEIMKVLTIIATIFMPLGFIAGLYGMNFNPHVSRWNMPELEWKYGYFYSLGLMAACASGMLLYFRAKGWIGPDSRTPKLGTKQPTEQAGRD